jgi:SAM-dependent methyltransferase
MSFDTLAPIYRGMELMFAGTLMQQSRTSFLGDAADSRHALVVGEGPGQFLAALLAVNSRASVTCVDQSARMIAENRAHLARRRLDERRVRFVQQDALKWTPASGAFDLVVTHFFLDCFPPDQLAGLVRRLANSATAGATWLLADFRLPTHGWRRQRARLLVALLYRFFRLTTNMVASRLTPPDDHLRAAGFALAARREWSFGLIHSDVWRRARP